jgi:hypothetical protein
MIPVVSLFAASGDEPFAVTAFMTLIIGIVVTGVILWDRRYRRVWQQSRAGKWPQSEGRFLSGEVIAMRTGRSQKLAGFEVWMDYEYHAGQQRDGIYRRPVPTKEAAELYIKRLTNQRVPVRVAARTPSLSCVLDKDVDNLLNLHPEPV